MPIFTIFLRLRHRLAMRRGHAVKIYAVWLALMAGLHIAAMMAIERMGLMDAVWVTTTTGVTVGYGDISAKLPWGRVATILLMYCGTIFVLPGLASLLFDRAADRRARKAAGQWRWKLNDHILIISTTGTESARYLSALVGQLRHDPAHRERPILIMTHGFDATGLPDDLACQQVVHVSGDGDSDREMTLCDAARAHVVVVLGDSRTPKADALVFDVVDRVRDVGFTGRIVSECEDDRNRRRLSTGPMDSSVRPSRGYPEMIARAVLAPGAEQVIEDMFTVGGVECEYIAFGGSPVQRTWRDTVMRVMAEDLGMPVAYRQGHTVVTAPSAGTEITADGIYVLMGQQNQEGCKQRVRQLLAA